MEQAHLAHGRVARRQSSIVPGYWTKLGFAAVLALGACSDESKTDPDQMTGPTSTAGVGGAGVTAGSGTSVGSAGVAGTSSGTGVPVAGVSAAGSSVPAAGSGGRTAAGTAAAGMTAAAGAGVAGSTSAGSGGSVAAGSGSSSATGCTRELLNSTVDAYFTALAAHDPSMLPRADNVKFTENGEVLELGKGLWENAGMVKYAHSALDTEACTSVSESVVPDGTTDIPLGLRLKLVDSKITEVETIAVRPGDYRVLGSNFPSNTNAISASRDRVKWDEVVPADQRNTRAEISGWLDKYFKTFPRGGCNFADNCQRLENGGGSFACSAALSCDTAAASGRAVLNPRLIVVDEETGIGVGFTLFMNNTDFHMIKMYGGKIYAVHAILGGATSSGWE